MFCGAYYYHGLLLRPRSCPFCLGTCTDPDWTRLQTWNHQSEPNKHIEPHVQGLDWDSKKCAEGPKFDHGFENLEAFEFPDFVYTIFNNDEFDWLSL